MARKIVFVTKDKGGYEASFPLALELKRLGCAVSVVAEGISADNWKAVGFELAFTGSFDFKQTPYEVDACAELKKIDPDVVVATMGSPINLEAKFGQAANELGIPLIIVEDVWGTSRRMPCQAKLAFTLDDFGAQLMRGLPQFNETKILVAENPAIGTYHVTPGIEQRIDRLREKYGKVVLFAGEGLGTTELLTLMFLSLEKSNDRCVVLPRFHPKYMNVPQNSAIWNGVAESFAGHSGIAISREFDDGTDLRDLAALADVTISGSSTALLYAAKFGRMAVSISTPLTRRLLGEQVAYEEYPGIELGIAVAVGEPCDLFASVQGAQPLMRQNAERVFRLMTVQDMADAVLSLV